MASLKQKQMQYGALRTIYRDQKPQGFYDFVTEGLDAKKFKLEDFSFRGLAFACGVTGDGDYHGGSDEQKMLSAYKEMPTTDRGNVVLEQILSESNPGVNTNALAIVTGELIANALIEGYERMEGLIGDELMSTLANQRLRGQRVAGITSVGADKDVDEAHPYEAT